MAVKILVKRKIPTGFEDPNLLKLLRKLRSRAIVNPNYISGETLRRIDNPRDYLVISTWRDVNSWNAWRISPERMEIQKQIDALLGVPTEYEIYQYAEPSDG